MEKENLEKLESNKDVCNNGWQNIGIMKKYARKNIDFKYRGLFMEIVEESFGYGLSKTLHKTQKYWSDLFGISERTFRTHINQLALDGHIKINHQKGYVSGGGSKAYSYSPVYPSNANIWMKDIKKDKDNHSGSMSEFEKQKNKLFKDGF